jgi:uncharacterized protein YprB with RNaseH-like and TPR domain
MWESGILTWEDFLNAGPSDLPISQNSLHREIIAESLKNSTSLDFFSNVLPAQEHWRLYSDFRDRAMYFDIETDGKRNSDSMTSITVFDHRGLRTYVRGRDLERAAGDLSSAELLISFYGRNFDVPIIESNLNLRLENPHMDLYYVFRSLDIRGGLKKIEERFSISRGNLRGVDGYYAVLLWRYFRNMGDRRALETLLAYNVEDVVNLGELSRIAFNMKLESLGYFGELTIEEPFHRPVNPYSADDELLGLVRDYISKHGK